MCRQFFKITTFMHTFEIIGSKTKVKIDSMQYFFILLLILLFFQDQESPNNFKIWTAFSKKN